MAAEEQTNNGGYKMHSKYSSSLEELTADLPKNADRINLGYQNTLVSPLSCKMNN